MRTTQLTLQTDFEQLNSQYAFFKFTAQHDKGKAKDSTKYAAVWYAGTQLDNLLDEQVILASLYRQGNQAYVLLARQSADSMETLRQKIAFSEHFSAIKVQPVTASDTSADNTISGVDLYQLLLNATANSQQERHQFNNLNGQLVLVPPFNKKTAVIMAFHFQLTSELVLVAKATTYQTKSYAKKTEKDPQKLAKKLAKPAYHLHLNTLKRDYVGKDDNAYIKAGIPHRNASQSALHIKAEKEFLNSRLAVLQAVVDTFNQRYDGIITAHWTEKIPDIAWVERFRLLQDKNALPKLITHMDIRLLDKIGTAESNVLLQDIHHQLTLLKIPSRIGKQEIAKACHLCLVKSEDSYQQSDNIDPYRQDFRYSRQHLTDELYKSVYQTVNAPILLKNLIKELWVKQSIRANHIDLLPAIYPLTDTWVFGMIRDKVYHLLELKSNGDYQYYQHDDGLLFQRHAFDSEIRLIQQANKPFEDNNHSPIEMFIISPQRDVNIILNQDECVMPDLAPIQAEIVAKDQPFPSAYSDSIELIRLFETDKSLISDDNWKNFTNDLHRLAEPISKKAFIDTLNSHYRPQHTVNKVVRALLRQQNIILNVSKAKDNLLEKLPDMFSIQAGKLDTTTAWYSVGYYHASLKTELSHMLHVRKIKALQGELKHTELLALMDVDWVRYNNFTVLPYPIKYLREIIAMQKQ